MSNDKDDESKPDVVGVLVERVARRKPTTTISDLVSPRKPPPVMPDPPMQPKPRPDVSQHVAALDVPAPHSDIVGLLRGRGFGRRQQSEQH